MKNLNQKSEIGQCEKGFNIDKHNPNMEIIYFHNAKVGKYMPVVRNLTFQLMNTKALKAFSYPSVDNFVFHYTSATCSQIRLDQIR